MSRVTFHRLTTRSQINPPRFWRIALMAAACISIPWTLACGASAQAAGNSEDNISRIQLSATFPPALVSQSYASMISVSGGKAPYRFSIASGTLPSGVHIDSATGAVAGVPGVAGVFSFSVQVTDATNSSASASFRLPVATRQTGSVTVTLSPQSTTLKSNTNQQFLATVSGTSNTSVTFSASAGTMAPGGWFVAPTVNEPTTVAVTATSAADPSAQATASVAIIPDTNTQPLAIQTSSLANADAGQAYETSLTADGGKPPYSWMSTGNLPAGVELSSSGQLSGTPTGTGAFSFTATVSDADKNTAHQALTLTVVNTAGNFDGPAELPRVYVNSALSDTPAPGKTTLLNTGADLQTALNAANCGDTIELQAGATYSGLFNLPAKACDDQHWIIIRTSAPDSALPPEGQRLTPCYAGVASLPNRPQYACSSPQNVLAKIQVSQGGISGPLVLLNGANHYRLLGLEITRPAGIGATIALITNDQSGTASYIVIDRCWIHGTAHDDTRRGVQAQGMTQIAVVDSYLNDFHCTALTGACTDSQAVSSGGGLSPNGPYKITGNFLESSGENILFSGMAANYAPSDIQISGNHFYKPMQWMPGAPGFVGGIGNHPFIAKNHIEFKNGQRALIENNIFENSWGGFSQDGYSILLTSRNNFDQLSRSIDCPNCQVTDITVRYNKISHVGNGFLIANLLVNGQPAAAGGRFSIHDDIVDDISSRKYNGGGAFAVIGNGWPTRVLNSINISHVTAFPDSNRAMLVLGNSQNNPQMWGFTFSNNILATGQFPIWSVGDYVNDCSAYNIPIKTITLCFKPYSFSNNVLIGSPKAFPPTTWPGTNFFAAGTTDVGFSAYNEGNGGDYTLDPSSPYKGKATDGTDPGANVAAVEQAISGVE